MLRVGWSGGDRNIPLRPNSVKDSSARTAELCHAASVALLAGKQWVPATANK
jgi:hypothetical protein